MIFMPAWRAVAKTFFVDSTVFWFIEMSIPARSNNPPLEAKSFCISITNRAVLAMSTLIGSGFASTFTTRLFEYIQTQVLVGISPLHKKSLRRSWAGGFHRRGGRNAFSAVVPLFLAG